MALRHRTTRTACVALLSLLIAACGHRDGAAAQGPYAREVADAIPKIEKATGLTYKRPPVVERKSKEEVRDFLIKQFDDERSQEDLAAQQILLRRLGLIPDTLDFRKMMLDLYTEQIVGFYDPATKVLYVIDGAKPSPSLLFAIANR